MNRNDLPIHAHAPALRNVTVCAVESALLLFTVNGRLESRELDARRVLRRLDSCRSYAIDRGNLLLQPPFEVEMRLSSTILFISKNVIMIGISDNSMAVNRQIIPNYSGHRLCTSNCHAGNSSPSRLRCNVPV